MGRISTLGTADTDSPSASEEAGHVVNFDEEEVSKHTARNERGTTGLEKAC